MNLKEVESKTRELMELRRMREELDAEIETLTDGIKAAMGDAESLTAGAYRLTWKAVTSSRLDTAAIKKELPDVAARYTLTSTVRRFTVC